MTKLYLLSLLAVCRLLLPASPHPHPLALEHLWPGLAPRYTIDRTETV